MHRVHALGDRLTPAGLFFTGVLLAAFAQGAPAPTLPANGPEADVPELTMAPVESDPEREEFARRIRLALIQYQSDRAFEARRTASDALDDLQARFGPWDQQQVLALRILAAAEQTLGDLDSATEALAQAQYLNRMNLGLHDLSQLPLLNEMTQLALKQGDFEAGNRLQEYAFYIQQRAHGEDSAELLPALYNLADWYLSSGNVMGSRSLYERALAIGETHFGETDLRLIRALKGLAGSFRAERFSGAGQDDVPAFTFSTAAANRAAVPIEDERMMLGRYSQGENALARVIEIYEAQEEIDPRKYADGFIELGDWHLVFDKWTAAALRYRQAREILLAAEWEEAEVDALFARPTPVVLHLPDARLPYDRTGLERQLGYVDYTYRVNTRGRTFDVEITDFGPEDVLNFRLKRALKEARFRPIMVAGEPVDSEIIEARHEFPFLGAPPAPEPEASEAPETEPADAPSENNKNNENGL